LCKSHFAEFTKRGLSLADYLACYRLPGPGTPIPDFDHDRVRIFRDGSVWKRRGQTPAWTQCKPALANGVVCVILPGPRAPRRYSVARLMCRTFHGPRPSGNKPLHYPDPDLFHKREKLCYFSEIFKRRFA
jgi:hypothetical protein